MTTNTTEFIGKCIYADKCSDYGKRCGECVNNPRKSYFQPDNPIYIPLYYPYPPSGTAAPYPYEVWRVWC